MSNKERLIEKWSKKLKLDPHWKITVHTIDDPHSFIVPNPGAWTAELYLSDSLQGEELEHVIVHEMLELQFHGISMFCKNMIASFVDCEKTSAILDQQFTEKSEQCIEKIACSILEMM